MSPGKFARIDVWFAPNSQPTAEPQMLGLLGQFAFSPCLIEPFRNAATRSPDSQLYKQTV